MIEMETMKSIQFSWFNKFSKWLATSDFDQINEQSYIRLASNFHKAEQKNDDKFKYIEQQLKKLQNNPDWNTVKLVELLLIPYLDEYDLDIDLHIQLHKAQELFAKKEYEFFMQEFAMVSTDLELSLVRKRALLAQLTESIHMYYEDRQLRSVFANSARFKIGFFFSIAILMSVFLLSIGILHPDGVYQYFSLQYADLFWIKPVATESTQLPQGAQSTDKIHLHYAVTALMAGGMGACFSMLISLKDRIETVTLQELDNIHSLHFIVTRIIIGVGAALICYYFFRADLLSGSLFPDFRNEQEISLTSKNFFTLIIWCFIAGFSEKLVPGILIKTEAQVDKK